MTRALVGICGVTELEMLYEALTEQAQHRSASIPYLIVAATARARGLEILHYDRDFDTIARYTEQPAHWIVPPGTVLPDQAQTTITPG